MTPANTPTPDPTPDLAELTRVSARIGCLSFGGPAGQIALMHQELVERRGWVDEATFLHALNFCHLLPGPEAQQLATWIGWRIHGWRGGLIAGLLFVLPGAFVILGLSFAYAAAAGLDWFQALFLGIKAAVLAIVAQALLRIAGRALDTTFKRVLAVAAFVALFAFAAPFPLVVLGAGAIGMAVARARPEWLGKAHYAAAPDTSARPRLSATIRTIAIGLALWAAPLALVAATLGRDHVLWQVGVFFSQLAIVTFGGAYAVLSYMAQEAVQSMHWLSAREMADGLGLAETTPGPLIMVTQFVGFMAGARGAAPLSPTMGAIAGAALTTWVTFVPCFLWIFALAPWMERIRAMPRIAGALAALTAAVVGVIANLSLWFAFHVLFARTIVVAGGPLRLELPVLSTIDWAATAIALGSAVLLLRLRLSVWWVLAAAAGAGLVMGTL